MLYLIMLLCTIYISTRKNILNYNLSNILQDSKYHTITFLCLLVIIIFISYKLYKLLKYTNTNHIITFLLAVNLIMVIVSLIIPFHDNNDAYSNIHVYTSMLASVFYLLFEIIALNNLKIKSIYLYNKIYNYFFVSLQMLIILFIFLGKVNSLIEIMYFITIIIPLYMFDNKKT